MASGRLPMDFLELMERRKYPFRIVQAVLRDNDLPTAQGWAPLRDKYKNLSKVKNEEFAATLAEINVNLTLYAQKAIALYPVSEKEAKNFIRIFQDLSLSSEYCVSYPFTLQEEHLAVKSSALSAAAVEGSKGNEQLLLAGKMYETKRERIEVADLGDSIPASLDGFDEVIAIRRTARQFFHAVTIRNRQSKNYLEIRLDVLGHFLAADYTKHFNAVKRWLNKRYEDSYDKKPIGNEINLFPAITSLYGSSDGRVRHLGATTNTASIKQERMRHKADDLRREAFHTAGRTAAALTEFNIEKMWDSENGSTSPSIEIPGRVATASGQTQHLPMAFIEGCTDSDDFDLVMSKLFVALQL